MHIYHNINKAVTIINTGLDTDLTQIRRICQRLRISHHTSCENNLMNVRTRCTMPRQRNVLEYMSYIHHWTASTHAFLTSPSTAASWLPKLLPTNLLPSSKYKVANAVGGLASSPDWVAMKRDAALRLSIRPRWESDDRRDERGRSMVISWWLGQLSAFWER